MKFQIYKRKFDIYSKKDLYSKFGNCIIFDKTNLISIATALFLHCTIINSQSIDFLKGKAFEIKNNPDSAIFYYSKILYKNASDEKVLIARARMYYQKQKYKLAIEDFEKANKASSDIADFGLAQCYARLGNLSPAINFLEKHLASRYKIPQITIRMDNAFSPFENSKEWKELWNKEWYDKYDYQIGEARFMTNNKDWMGVINFVSDIIKNDTKHHELLYYRARAFYEMNNYTTAANDYSKAVEINKHHFEYFEGRADTYLKLRKEKDAISDLSSAINLAPDVFGLYLKRSETYLLSGDYELAKSDVDFYQRFFETDTNAIYLSGKVSLALGNYLEALSLFNYLINNYPQTARYYLSRGETFEKTSMSSNALKDYNRCLNIEPDNIIALRKRGELLLNKGDRKSACQDFKKAMNLGDFQSNNLYLDNCR